MNGGGGGSSTGGAPGQQQAAQPAPAQPSAPAPARPGAPWPAARSWPAADLLAGWVRDYVTARAGQQVTVLCAGCVTAPSDLGAQRLRDEGFDVRVSLIDDDQPVTRAVVAASPALARCTLGDLRTVPLPPRSFDLVLSSFLLDRVRHAEVVLDRLAAATKPGGLLFLCIRDRDCAAGFLDRVLPQLVRRSVWHARQPGQPGPHPAIYEPLSSARGVQAYAQLRGLMIAQQRALGGPGGRPGGLPLAQRFISRLSRGRLTAAHEELLYVLRKPEDQFARLL
ncbi:MAG: class I SAM-dependent methyltransferase [Actinobacteria bacterium]|nr:class I SAM-dependent methyltransferase [Actinomycetota bacterium]